MTTHPAIRCQSCGGLTYREYDEDGDVVLICADDDCPNIVVGVTSREDLIAGAFTPPDPFSRKA